MAFQPIYAIRDSRGKGTLLPYNQGVNDGSTLTLDFTTGVLDPRLTFTRGSNATFINSSGLVQWAASNQLSNSLLAGASGSSGPTGWLVSFIGGTGNFSLSGTELTISNNGSADRSRIYQTGPNGNGLPVTVQMKIVANNTGGLSLAEIVSFAINGQTSATYRVNGVAQTSSYTGWNAGDLVTLTCIPTVGSAATCLFGVGVSNNVAKSASVTIKDVQIEAGTTATAYNPTTTSGAYYAPRFDHDPDTRAPRGLLIEGQATNEFSYSEDFSNGAWSKANTNSAMPLTGTAPDGSSTSRLLEENTTSYGKHSLERLSAITITANNVYTLSVWLKEPLSNSRRYAHIQLADGQATAARYTVVADLQTGEITAFGANNGTAGAPTGTSHRITAFPEGWYRVSISMNQVASPCYPAIMLGDSATLFGGNNQPFYNATTPYKGLIVWGAMLEKGAGASSYIPTGASQATRLADSAVMNDIAPLNYSATNGSIYWSGIINKQPTSYITLVGFMTAIDQPAYETFGNALSYFTAARGPTLNIGGSNEVSRTYVLGSLIKYASSVNTLQDPIVAVNLNGSASSTNKSGTGDLRVATRFVIGRQPSSTYGAEYPSVTIRSIKYWPTSKGAAELAVLTA